MDKPKVIEVTEKSVQMTINVWRDEDTNEIKISMPGNRISTVNQIPFSKRGNPHLYNKLNDILEEQKKDN